MNLLLDKPITDGAAAQRFFRDIVLSYAATDECLIWPFARSHDGYGRLLWGDRARYVSRLVCEAAYDPPPTPEHEAAHSCGRGHEGCVSKAHLRWATHAENQAEKIIHGTSTRGERSGNAKLTEADIHRIRSLESTMSQVEIAEKFGVSKMQISRILRGEQWAWLP